MEYGALDCTRTSDINAWVRAVVDPSSPLTGPHARVYFIVLSSAIYVRRINLQYSRERKVHVGNCHIMHPTVRLNSLGVLALLRPPPPKVVP